MFLSGLVSVKVYVKVLSKEIINGWHNLEWPNIQTYTFWTIWLSK